MMSKEEINQYVDKSMEQEVMSSEASKKMEQKSKEEKEGYMSANEKFTSEEDQEETLESLAAKLRADIKSDYYKQKKDLNQKQKERSSIFGSTSGFDSSSDIKSGSDVDFNSPDISDSTQLDFDEKTGKINTKKLFDNMYQDESKQDESEYIVNLGNENTDEAKLNMELDSQWKQMQEYGEGIMYGASTKRKAVLAKEFLREQHVERLIPRKLIESLKNYDQPKLEFDNVDSIREEYEVSKNMDYTMLNTSIFVEIYKEKLQGFRSRKDELG